MNGVDMDERMALMGHKTITAARIYTHFYTKKLSESLERLMNAYRGALVMACMASWLGS